MGVPFGCWVGEKDTFLKVDKIAYLFRSSASKDCEVTVIKGASHLGTILESPDYVGKWIIETAKKMPPKTKKTPEEIKEQNLKTLQEHARGSPLTLPQALTDALIQMNLLSKELSYIVSPEGAQLGYTVFEPETPARCCMSKMLFLFFEKTNKKQTKNNTNHNKTKNESPFR